MPTAFVDAELAFLTGVKFAGHIDVPAVELRAPDGRRWRTGRTERTGVVTEDTGDVPYVVVSGPPAELVGWLTGRAKGTGLDTRGGPLPALPRFSGRMSYTGAVKVGGPADVHELAD